MWREINMGTFLSYYELSDHGTHNVLDRSLFDLGTHNLDCLVNLCQYAVDLSSGHLEK